MIDLLSHIAGVVMLLGVILMALPVIRVAPWGYAPMFEAGFALFLLGVIAALVGAIGWLIGTGIGLSMLRYPLSGA